jgi:hypothetical protein
MLEPYGRCGAATIPGDNFEAMKLELISIKIVDKPSERLEYFPQTRILMSVLRTNVAEAIR